MQGPLPQKVFYNLITTTTETDASCSANQALLKFALPIVLKPMRQNKLDKKRNAQRKKMQSTCEAWVALLYRFPESAQG